MRPWLNCLPEGLQYPIKSQGSNLSSGQKQLTEIAKAISQKARVLILDEPSTALSVSDVERLFVFLRQLKAEGVAIIYVSHRMDEIARIADAYLGYLDRMRALDLAIAVLEDSNGVIDLDLPITGSLDDPQFSYGRLIWKAITNVLTRVVTAPFRALGSLLGRDADKAGEIQFDPGSAALAPPEQEKLQKIAQALAKRPALRLGQHGAGDQSRRSGQCAH